MSIGQISITCYIKIQSNFLNEFPFFDIYNRCLHIIDIATAVGVAVIAPVAVKSNKRKMYNLKNHFSFYSSFDFIFLFTFFISFLLLHRDFQQIILWALSFSFFFSSSSFTFKTLDSSSFRRTSLILVTFQNYSFNCFVWPMIHEI